MSARPGTAAGCMALAAIGLASPAAADPCFGDRDCQFALQAEAAPDTQPWNQPARIAYTFNNKGKDSVAIAVAGKGTMSLESPLPLFALAELSWQKNSQQDKPQNNLQAAVGLSLELQSGGSEGPVVNRDRLFSLWIDARLGYNRKAVYADPDKAPCPDDPANPVCRTQHVGSIRGTIDFMPHWGFFTGAEKWSREGESDRVNGPPVIHSVGLLGTAFYDNATENTFNPETGRRITGTVTGIKGKVGAALSPRFTQYRAVLRADVQAIRTLSRGRLRVDDFDDFAHLVTVSLDWDLGDRSFAKGAKRFKPSIGVTYTDGSDPLTGRKDQSTWVVGLKVAFN